ncbi:MAG: ABC transporter ATP-binding protein [Aliishimia sp.]
MRAPTLHLRGSYHLGAARLFGPFDVSLQGGQWTCLLGRSGVGKSTLLRLIAGLPCAGEFDGSITASDGTPVTDRISYMAQSDLLLPWLNVLENTVLGAHLRGMQPDLERAKSLLDRVGLAAHQSKRPDALSGGMRQRAALARTLMEDRPIALLDEPFSALDASTRAQMQELAAEVLSGKTVLLVTHDPAEAVRLGHQIVVFTPNAATFAQVPKASPVRDPFAPDTLTCQSTLLDCLRGSL